MKKLVLLFISTFAAVSSFGQYTWHDVTDTLHRTAQQDIRKVKFANKDTGYIIGPNLFKYTHDAGKSWHDISTALPVADVICASSTVAYASADSGLVMRTADAGVNWSTVNLPVKRLTGLHRVFGEDNVYAVTYTGSMIFNPWLEEYVGMGPSGWKFDTLWHSTDGSAHWSKITNVKNGASNVFRYLVDDSTYIRNTTGTNIHGMEVSYNTGTNYTKDYPFVETFSIQQLPSGTFYWVCNSDNFNYLLSSSNRFKNYQEVYKYDISQTNQLMFKRLSFANETYGWVYGGQLWPIYKTNDGGQSFFQDKQGLSSLADFWNIQQVQLLDSNYGWGIVGIDTGRNRLVKYGEYTTPDTGTGPTPTGIYTPVKSIVSIYPNPGTGIFTIGASTPVEQVNVFSLDGKAILTTRENVINLANQNSGIYMVEILLKNGERLYEKLVKE